MIYLTADWHVGSNERVKDTFSPFNSSKGMMNQLLFNTNMTVTESDTLVIVGDFCNYSNGEFDCWMECFDVIKKINCNVELLLGNNELRLVSETTISVSEFIDMCIKSGIKSVDVYKRIKTESGEVLHVAHMPQSRDEDGINVFGHCHCTGPITGLGYNVSCFCNHFRPVSVDQILKAKQYVKEYFMLDTAEILLSESGYCGWGN